MNKEHVLAILNLTGVITAVVTVLLTAFLVLWSVIDGLLALQIYASLAILGLCAALVSSAIQSHVSSQESRSRVGG